RRVAVPGPAGRVRAGAGGGRGAGADRAGPGRPRGAGIGARRAAPRRGGRSDRAVSVLVLTLAVSSLAYFALLNGTYLVFTAIAWGDVTRHLHRRRYDTGEPAFASPL